MILDLEKDAPPSSTFDVAVIGAGAAGITLARTLGARGKRVLLVEAGDEQPNSRSQDLAGGRVTGNNYQPLDATRVRALGGTTGIWGGMCRPLDPLDFESRPEINRRGWPISHSDLRPFEQPACDILDLRPFGTDKLCDHANGELRDLTFRKSTPTRFGKKYRTELAESSFVTVLLNANVTGFDIDDSSSSRVAAVRFRTHSSPQELPARATSIVLCCGGIENARLLLVANEQHGNRLGNSHGMVGRCFMEHPHISPARFVITSRDYAHNQFGDNDLDDEVRGLALAPDALIDLRLAGCSLFLLGVAPRPLPDGGQRVDLERFIPFSDRVDIPKTQARYFGSGSVIMASEQLPNYESRVMLDADRDALGMKRSHLHWTVTNAERRAVSELVLRVGRYLARSGYGRMHVDPWITDETLPHPVGLGGHHHVGATRMAVSEYEGVVDANCRVFGTENLFISGGSVFSTSGFTNPTFTIVQLALRLADHLMTV